MAFKYRNTAHLTKRCGKLIPSLRTRNGERSGNHDDETLGTSYCQPTIDELLLFLAAMRVGHGVE